MILRVGIVLLSTALVCFGGLVGFVTLQESRVIRDVSALESYDAIIVLGAQVKADGTPSIQLSWRLEAAAEAWEKHPVPIVVCGAQGTDEPMTEAEAMKIFLMDKGIPEDYIRTDPDSFNTKQNLQNAGKLLQEFMDEGKTLIVSSDYHVPRAMALARDEGLDPIGLGSPCKAEYWMKNHFREALAWGKYAANKYLNLSF